MTLSPPPAARSVARSSTLLNLAAPLSDGQQVLVPGRARPGAPPRPPRARRPRPRLAGRPQHGVARGARRAARRRPRHRPANPRLPERARAVRVGRRARRGPRDRAGPPRAATRAGDGVSPLSRVPAPHLAAGSFCAGLSLALAARAAGGLARRRCAGPRGRRRHSSRRRRVELVALGLVAGGWWLAKRSARGDGSQRARRRGGTGGAGAARGHGPGPDEPVHDPRTRPCEGAVAAAGRRAVPARAPREDPRAAAGCPHRDRCQRAPATAEGRGLGVRRGGVPPTTRVLTSCSRPSGTGSSAVAAGSPESADRVRAALARSIAPGLEGERRALVAGVVLGEDEGLAAGLRERFRASGLYHLLAVSGQNVAYVVAGILLAAWLAGVPRWLAQVAALAAVLGYVAAVGWQPSVVRAGVAGGLATLAWLAARPRDRWYFALVGAAVLLAWNPYSLLDPGFQLSFAAVAAIFVLVPRLERRLEGYPVPRRLAGIVALSAALRRRHGADPVAALRRRLRRLGARERARRSRRRAHSRPRPRSRRRRHGASRRRRGPRLAERLARLVPRLVCPGDRRPSLRSGSFGEAARRCCGRRRGGARAPAASPARAARRSRMRRSCRSWRRSRGCSGRGHRLGSSRHRQGCESRSSTSARETRRCCRCPKARCSSTRDRQRRTSSDSSIGSGSSAWRRSCSPILNETTLAARRPSCGTVPVGVVLDPRQQVGSPYEQEALREAAERADRGGRGERRPGVRARPPGAPRPLARRRRPARTPTRTTTPSSCWRPTGASTCCSPPTRRPTSQAVSRCRPSRRSRWPITARATTASDELLERLRARVAVISVGSGNDYGHPTPSTLAALEQAPRARRVPNRPRTVPWSSRPTGAC